jgi:hypothetical protein
LSVKDIFGIGASWIGLRSKAAKGQLDGAPVIFGHCQSLENAGVLLLLPSLIANGLLSYQEHYEGPRGVYYGLDFTILLLSFMFLCRIKNPEQLKHINSSEFGKLLGIDKVPEARCLRKRIGEIASQKKSGGWMEGLFENYWLGKGQGDGFLFYIDGHVQVYHGSKANLGKKYVSRQKLCLPGTGQYWVNDSKGNPYLYVNSHVNEKLHQMLREEIVPQLLQYMYRHGREGAGGGAPIFTVIFDREGYSPSFFKELWGQSIAVITYRKNVKDKWEEKDFGHYEVEVEGDKVEMLLCEKEIELEGLKMREIRKLSEDGHQASVITTNRELPTVLVARYMFARWCQENFFRYMRQEYDLDRIYQYAVEQINEDIQVVNPIYSNLTYQIKKTREKILRKNARLYQIETENISQGLDSSHKYEKQLIKALAGLEKLREEERQLLEQRKQCPYKIAVKEMPDKKRYNQLMQERNHLLNIIKMICYRAETILANLIPSTYKKTANERRAFIKSIIKRAGDIRPDYQNKTLTVSLYTMSTPRENESLRELCALLNETETKFPGTDMKIIYEIATI